MAQGPAHVSSPDVIRRCRAQFVKFDEDCRASLDGIRADVYRIEEWLRREQGPHWKHELRRLSERVEKARRDYVLARNDTGPTRKPSCVDEKKALDKAVKLRDEAERKVRAVAKGLQVTGQEVAKALGPCTVLSSRLATLAPRCLARLDQMLDSLDEYLRPAAGGPTE